MVHPFKTKGYLRDGILPELYLKTMDKGSVRGLLERRRTSVCKDLSENPSRLSKIICIPVEN